MVPSARTPGSLWARLAARRAARDDRRRRAKAHRFYGQFVRPGSLCFDIGANVGDRTAILVELGAQVVAVEPQEPCVAALEERFSDIVTIVPEAVGSAEGEGELLVADYPTLATLSPRWVEAVRASGRFSSFAWNERVPVRVTTLDGLIARFGTPDFCKIDVEGFELEVVRGLSSPVAALSFEFTFELLESRLACVEHLDALGMRRFNFSSGESLRFVSGRWIDAGRMRAFLETLPGDPMYFGDVYALA